MWPDRVSNPGPLTYESGDLPTACKSRPLITRVTKMKTQELHPLRVPIVFANFLKNSITLKYWQVTGFETNSSKWHICHLKISFATY